VDYSTASGEEKLPEENSFWAVYLLRCSDGSLYAGVTVDLTRRVRQHNGELVGGARYTQCRRPVSVVWSRSVPDRGAAQRLEAQLKRLSKSEKERLVSGVELTIGSGEQRDGK